MPKMGREEEILETVQSFLIRGRKLREIDFDWLFFDEEPEQQRQIRRILMDHDIEFIADEDSDLEQDEELPEEREGRDKTGATPAAGKLSISKAAKPLLELTNEELCVLYQNGESLALEALLYNNQGLVGRMARDICGEFVQGSVAKRDMKDIYDYGYMGIMEAAKRFDATRGNLFSTYAGVWINKEIRKGIIQNENMIKVREDIMNDVRRLFAIRAKNPGMSEEELAGKMGHATTVEKVRELLEIGRLTSGFGSLSAPVDEDAETERGDLLPSEISVEKEAERNRLWEAMETAMLSTLSSRGSEIVRLYHGLAELEDGGKEGKEKILSQIAEKYDITREEVARTLKKAMKTLKKDERLRDFYENE